MAITLNGTTGIVSPKVDALDLELNSVNVVERGSNANGEYVRFADGTQICTAAIVLSSAWSGNGSVFSTPSASFTFPAAFIVPAPRWACSEQGGVGFSWVGLGNSAVGLSSGTVAAHRASSPGTFAPTVTYVAIGRWY
jgi:hypothetical protein